MRETRKIVGEYVLREDDVLGARDFEDGIGRCAWPLERHVEGGLTSWTFLEPGASYAIPFRCLLPRCFVNLMVAGRCLSADSAAFGSVRVIGPCMLEGQAVAAAARQICDDDVPAASVDMERLRSVLTDLGGSALRTPRLPAQPSAGAMSTRTNRTSSWCQRGSPAGG